jgi:hypothetical protein
VVFCDHALVGCTKMEFRADSLSMVAIIFPNVLSFLTGGDDDNDAIGCDGDDYATTMAMTMMIMITVRSREMTMTRMRTAEANAEYVEE